ncbi:MFS general substrate transporter [Pluteus cervinus]|uniref:MFS general substrate transporter n=1 Tax=Pluteus cervinus TaxID=181527 RepID=A0ACD3B0X6_9AGAR|nr:MFS general substrate transporter [Pluteus cervinus]
MASTNRSSTPSSRDSKSKKEGQGAAARLGSEDDFVRVESLPRQDGDYDPLPPSGTLERIEAEKRLVRKLDMRVLPTIVLIFIMNYIDRNGITTARLKGMEQDLGISDVQYNTVIAILFVSYCPAQVPSNMILNYISRPSLYIGICVVAWGVTSALTGITKDYGGILACRIFIGLPEAAFYPGAVYLLSRWYTKKELAFRSAILYAGLLISNAFGALMAAGILSNMEGVRGIRAWRWLFFIEGAITVFIGLHSMWLLPDYPHNTRWISADERRLAQARLSEDAGEADKDNAEDSPMKGLKMAVKDVKVWIFAVMTVAQLLGLSFVQFFPTLTQTLGFSTTVSLLLAAPPWIVASAICCLNAWHADKTGERFFHIAGWWWGVILGFIISLSTASVAARYVSMFFMACGYVGFAMTLVWVSNALPRPPAKRAAAIGIVNGMGNLGNLIGSYTWKSEWGPGYHQSMAISLAALVFSTALAVVIRVMLIRENKKMDDDDKAIMEGANRERIEAAAQLEGITVQEALERRRKYRNLY